jgi:ubiquitin-small subunit ribosomal protein S27Ae
MPVKPAPKKEEPVKKEEAKPAAAAEAASAAPKVQKAVRPMYKGEGEKVSRTRPTCERCGPGYFMGDHHDRYTCGHCGFTRYKQK